MEEYLENMRSLRSYMNDLEEDAAKWSAKEQQQRTAIEAHNADIALVFGFAVGRFMAMRAQAKQASEVAGKLATARAQVCVDMAEKQGRIATLDVECAMLKQTLELLHQEIASTSANLNEKRKMVQLWEWLGSFKNKSTTMEPHVTTSQSKQTFIKGERDGTFNSEFNLDNNVGNKHSKFRGTETGGDQKGVNGSRSKFLSKFKPSAYIPKITASPPPRVCENSYGQAISQPHTLENFAEAKLKNSPNSNTAESDRSDR
ncbi:hypothetical protein PVAP13_6NG161200 [Panicum virgatum]|uniref:Uncharacterized protein n=1 Tax=Panicum virgatum TaxID=38727 RepID=A0A8T0QXP3_PANVG|nr:hypothetical protein PVAP13_6NG161200 [Panicum virgatum]